MTSSLIVKQAEQNLDKTQLRRNLLTKRQSLSIEEWRDSSDCLTHHLSTSIFTQAKTVLAYFSFRLEPDLSRLFTDSSRLWGFPRCVAQSLIWHSWKHGDSVITGAYGIPEPHPDSPAINSHDVDLILVPCVACDSQGYRLGYGGGYYDRLLCTPEWSTKFTVGIVFDFAYLPQIPVEDWDTKLHAVCTETGFKMID